MNVSSRYGRNIDGHKCAVVNSNLGGVALIQREERRTLLEVDDPGSLVLVVDYNLLLHTQILLVRHIALLRLGFVPYENIPSGFI